MFTGYNHEHYSDPTASKAINLCGKAPNRPDHRPGCRYAGRSPHHLVHRTEDRAPSQPPCPTERLSLEARHTAPLIYVCSRLHGRDKTEVKQCILQAGKFSRFVLSQMKVPIAPRLLYFQFLEDSVKEDRLLGAFFSFVILCLCDEVWVYIPDDLVSSEMEAEMESARRLGIPVRIFNKDMKEVMNHE